nr:hypothetical protein [Solirubrobacterales bacterium]
TVATAGRAFDVSLGPDVRGRVVALYTRCRTATRGCDVYRYDLRTRRASRVRSVSSRAFDESWPAQWRDRVVVSRRIRTHVVSRLDRRPDPSGRGPLAWCSTPYVKTLSSRAPARRLNLRCHDAVGIAIRDDMIVHASETDVDLLRASGGPSRLLAHGGEGEGGYSPFISPNLSASAVWLTRTGEREGEPQGFLRIDLPSGRITAVRPNLPVAGRLARDERGTFWYVQGPEPGFDYRQQPPFCVSSLDPCRLVRASASPFSTKTRTLLPRLRLLAPSFLYPTVFADRPVVLSGDVTRAVVRGRDLVSRLPAPASTLRLLTSAGAGPASFVPIGPSTRPDAAGRWSLVLRQPPPAGSFAVDAVRSRLRSPVLVVESLSRIAFAASGRALTGSVTPAQPGRIVDIERLAADAQGRLPDGRQVCRFPNGICDPEAWVTVARAPLGTAGAGFSATVESAGRYRARLPDRDAQGGPRAYGGVSQEIDVG